MRMIPQELPPRLSHTQCAPQPCRLPIPNRGSALAATREEVQMELRLHVAAPVEETLDVDDIQGHVLPGFNKPNLIVAALEISDVAQARLWFREIAPSVATLAQVFRDRLRFRELRLAQT